MGSLRTLYRDRQTPLTLFGKIVRKSDQVSLYRRDEGGYFCVWKQGSLDFSLKTYLERDSESGEWTNTVLEIRVEARLPPEPGDNCSYYRVWETFKKPLSRDRHTYEYARETLEWRIEDSGIFAVRDRHPDFPWGWERLQ